jgi:hypothetical protein
MYTWNNSNKIIQNNLSFSFGNKIQNQHRSISNKDKYFSNKYTWSLAAFCLISSIFASFGSNFADVKENVCFLQIAMFFQTIQSNN